MSETAPVPLVKGMALGGVLISAIGAASTVFGEGKKPSFKSLSRDFIIGSVMVALIMQILPESSTTLVQFILGLVPLSLFRASDRGSVATAPVSEAVTGNPLTDLARAVSVIEETEFVKVGVPRF